jgi:hypothetical protein
VSRYLSPLLIVLVVLAVLAGSVYLYLTVFRGVPDLPQAELPGPSAPSRSATAPPPPPPPLILPELDESDEFVRPLVQALSSHPRIAAWLVNEGLVRRFVVVVDNVARGDSPSRHLPFLAPEGRFEVEEVAGKTVISEASRRRYDLLAAAIASLDTTGSVRLYRDLSPLFEEAYDELGNPDTFEDALAAAIDRVLAVEVPDGEIAVAEGIESWTFAEARLERLGPVAKQLLRMGPDNAREIQGKLRTIKTALALTRAEGDR